MATEREPEHPQEQDPRPGGDAEVEIPAHLMQGQGQPRSWMLLRLLRPYSARRVLEQPAEDPGLAEHLPYPFMALVGQPEMRPALLLAAINPNVGGVLLIGPRGTGKTTAARGLSDLLPPIPQSTCPYGCLPEDYEAQGADGVCGECAEKLARGESITRTVSARLVVLPLNARLEDVIGGISERAAIQQGRVRLDRGILSRADRGIVHCREQRGNRTDIARQGLRAVGKAAVEHVARQSLRQLRVAGLEGQIVGGGAAIECLAECLHAFRHGEVADPHLAEVVVHIGAEAVEQGLRQALPVRRRPQPAQHQPQMQDQHVEPAVNRVAHVEPGVKRRFSRLRHDHAIDGFDGAARRSGGVPETIERPEHFRFPRPGRRNVRIACASSGC